MSKRTLLDKVWDLHKVDTLPTGQDQIFVGRHLIHEVTSPQAFEQLRDDKMKVRRPDLSSAVLDHVIPTHDQSRPYEDEKNELMAKTLEENVAKTGIKYFGPGDGQGVCHVVFPEKGIIWPGMTAACGDSHTCTYGALGALAFGIGTSEVVHVLATQTLALEKLKVRRVNFTGGLQDGVSAKDLVLELIKETGVKGGVGYAYEFGGSIINRMSMEGRLTLCNMAVEGGARSGYVNPDNTTFEYLRGSEFAPKDFDTAVKYWKSIASDKDAEYDDILEVPVGLTRPMVTWGTNPAQAIYVRGHVPNINIPSVEKISESDIPEMKDAMEYMGLEPGQDIEGLPVDVAFIGSCTNGRPLDLQQAAYVLKRHKVKIPTYVVPGSEAVKAEAERRGLDQVFIEAGAEWRYPGCSMCLAMNPDKLVGNQRSISTSNRNFKGRQGSPTGRTHLASPYTMAASRKNNNNSKRAGNA
jgi:3-isopropylmalate/(R)-2-methylmalate dehydratase large subunit